MTEDNIDLGYICDEINNKYAGRFEAIIDFFNQNNPIPIRLANESNVENTENQVVSNNADLTSALEIARNVRKLELSPKPLLYLYYLMPLPPLGKYEKSRYINKTKKLITKSKKVQTIPKLFLPNDYALELIDFQLPDLTTIDYKLELSNPNLSLTKIENDIIRFLEVYNPGIANNARNAFNKLRKELNESPETNDYEKIQQTSKNILSRVWSIASTLDLKEQGMISSIICKSLNDDKHSLASLIINLSTPYAQYINEAVDYAPVRPGFY